MPKPRGGGIAGGGQLLTSRTLKVPAPISTGIRIKQIHQRQSYTRANQQRQSIFERAFHDDSPYMSSLDEIIPTHGKYRSANSRSGPIRHSATLFFE
jgi:hypothetical protein